MLLKLFLLFTLVPFAEIALLIEIGTVAGTLNTILIVIGTGIIGAVMVRAAGIQCLFNIQRDMQSGRLPTDELLNGLFILVAGAFLITPGLLTDTVGFLFLVPPVRTTLRRMLKKYVASKINPDDTTFHMDIRM